MLASLVEYEVTFKSPSMGIHFEPVIKSGTKQKGCKIKSFSTIGSQNANAPNHDMLEVGDELTAINGSPVAELSYVAILQALKGLVSLERTVTFTKKKPSSTSSKLVGSAAGLTPLKDTSLDTDGEGYKSSISAFSTPDSNISRINNTEDSITTEVAVFSASNSRNNISNLSMNDESFQNASLSLSSIIETTPKKMKDEFTSRFNPQVCNLEGGSKPVVAFSSNTSLVRSDKGDSHFFYDSSSRPSNFSNSKSKNNSKSEFKSLLLKDPNSEPSTYNKGTVYSTFYPNENIFSTTHLGPPSSSNMASVFTASSDSKNTIGPLSTSQVKKSGGGNSSFSSFDFEVVNLSPTAVRSIAKSKSESTARKALGDINPNTSTSYLKAIKFDAASASSAEKSKNSGENIVEKSKHARDDPFLLSKDFPKKSVIVCSNDGGDNSSNSNSNSNSSSGSSSDGSNTYTCKKSDKLLPSDGGNVKNLNNPKLGEQLGLNQFLASVKSFISSGNENIKLISSFGYTAGTFISTAIDSMPQYTVSDMDRVNTCKFKLLQELSETSYTLGVTIDRYAKELEEKNAEIIAHTTEINDLNKKNRELKKGNIEKANAITSLNQQLDLRQAGHVEKSEKSNHTKGIKTSINPTLDWKNVAEIDFDLREENQNFAEINALLRNELAYKGKEVEDYRLRLSSLQEKSRGMEKALHDKDMQHKEDVERQDSKIRMLKEHLDRSKSENQSVHLDNITLVDKYRIMVDKLSALNSEHVASDTKIRYFLSRFNEIVKMPPESGGQMHELHSIDDVLLWFDSHYGSLDSLKVIEFY
jgi:hypothetical protein